MLTLSESFRGKKVFVTGHTGFKGSWLIAYLNLLGADVMGYALDPVSSNSLYNQINGDSLCKSIISDIRDIDKLRDSLLSYQPDFIFHLAAQPLVRYSYEFSLDTFSINIIGTSNLLEVVKELEKKCVVVIITTDKVYHNLEIDYYYREEDKIGGYDPYSASKGASEIVIDSYRNSFFNVGKYCYHNKSISVARAGNVIGGGDWSNDRIIPDVIKSLYSNNKIIIRNPNSIRPWQHVLDPLNGYLTLAAAQAIDPISFSTAFNFGPIKNDVMTVESLVKKAIEIWGTGDYDCINNDNKYHEASLLKLDISKAKNILKWSPKLNSESALKNTIDWYKKHFENPSETKENTFLELIEYIKL